MRRVLVGSILLCWIASLAGVVVHGIGAAENGLLNELQIMLMETEALSLSFGLARAILTGIVVLALTVALWALMLALATEERERRDRIVSLGAAFSCVLGLGAFLMIAAVFAGSPEIVGMLIAVQAATLVSMLAAGGVEFAWERGLAGAPAQTANAAAGWGDGAQVPADRIGLTAFRTPANDPGPH